MTTVFDLTCCPPRLLLRAHSRTTWKPTTVWFPNSVIMVAKNIANAQKPNFRSWFLLFLPLMMFSVAKQRVMMAGRVRECALRHKALTAARKLEELKHQQRSFEGFC